jgi:hypothetical protein
MAQKSPTLDLLEPEQIWKASLLSKVKGYIDDRVFDSLNRCGDEPIYATCADCKDVRTFYYQCNLKFCPLCNWRIARKRTELLKLYAASIEQPKHAVVTQRNFEVLVRKRIREFGQNIAKLRRTKIWKNVKGGCVSTEITNEGRGWHLHAHMFIDCRWLDGGELAQTWAKIIKQDTAIVKVKDAREMTYLGEITKYVVKGAQLVSWHPEHIAQFIGAIRGVRFFATFGSLFKLAAKFRAELLLQKPPPKPCKCGCCEFYYESEQAAVFHEAERATQGRRR